jgi:predicted small metal-binding protein
MKRFACGDVVPGCDAMFVCGTDDEILSAVARHAAVAHGMAKVPGAVLDQVRAHISLVS